MHYELHIEISYNAVTFCIKGYGNIYPALHARCGFITFLCSAEVSNKE